MIDRGTALEALREGEIGVVGRIVASSNNAMLVSVTRVCPDPEPALVLDAIYKPILGERPLDDFPDGPFGEGMVQAFVDADPEVDVVAMVVDDDPRLRRMAVLDAVINNTDRKGGHILPVDGGRHVYGVDHGVTFSPMPKLRTVLWGWRGEPLGQDEIEGLERIRTALDGDLGRSLTGLLSRLEIRATARRTEALLAAGCFPFPSPDWPAIPWPPF